MSAVPHVSSDWHTGFLSVLPAVQTHARIRFRELPAEQREEAISETIAAACTNYQLAAAQGKLHAVRPGMLADFAVRHVRTGRHVGGKQDAAQDLLSPVAQRRHHLNVRSYHGNSAGAEDWQQLTGEDRRVSIPDLAAFRVDFSRWLGTVTLRDRGIIAALVSGETTNGVARKFGLTAGRVSQLRREYERRWQVFQGEVTVAARAS